MFLFKSEAKHETIQKKFYAIKIQFDYICLYLLLRQGQQVQRRVTGNPAGILEEANDWILLVDFKHRLIIPAELAVNSESPLTST